MSLETMTKLQTVTLSSSQNSVSFTNIPQGYTDLVIQMSARSDRAGNRNDGVYVKFNDATTDFFYQVFEGNGAATTSGSGTAGMYVGEVTAATATSGIFSNSQLYIFNYSGNTYKACLAETSQESQEVNSYMEFVSTMWNNPAPITKITLTANFNFVIYSKFTLYGIKNARQTAGNSIKATGGNIVLDGTYVYHVFNSTGVFTPTQPILADCLVVAGGGGGSYLGGGGGGGYRTSVGGTPMSISSNISYTVTVGAGGAKTTSGANAFSGTNSSFNSITSTGGGGGGGITEFGPSGSGGSSGGASSKAFTDGPNTLGTANLGGYSPVEGYVGGSGTTSTSGSLSGGGGGGGGGGAGEAGSSNKGGSGGVGRNFTIDGVITGYSGGGGGGAGTDTGGLNSTATHGGAPGAFRDSTINTTAIANRGGGGGGGGNSGGGNAGAGGSGIVIIRYKG